MYLPPSGPMGGQGSSKGKLGQGLREDLRRAPDRSIQFQGEGQEQELNPKQRSEEVKPGEVPRGHAQTKGGRFSGDRPSQSKERERTSLGFQPL